MITSGFMESNYARTTAVAARQLGLQPHLVLWWREGELVSELHVIIFTYRAMLNIESINIFNRLYIIIGSKCSGMHWQYVSESLCGC